MNARSWLALGILACVISAAYTYCVLEPWKYQEHVADGHMLDQMGDLYPRWVGTRDLLLYRRNPYSPEVSHEIQMAFYGHAIIQDYASSQPKVDEQRFAYPVYVVFLLAPTVYLTYAQVQTWSLIILAISAAACILIWLDVLRWRLSTTAVFALTLLFLSSPQITQGLRFRQLGLLVGFLLSLGTWCIAKNHLATAGVAFAFSTIKPQMILLPLIWFLWWAASDWTKRWRLPAGFFVTMAALAGAGEVILPGWVRDFIEGLRAYPKYVHMKSLPQMVFGDAAGYLFGGVLVLCAMRVAWRNRRYGADSREFLLTLSAVCIIEALALPLLHPFNHIILVLPMLMILRDWASMHKLVRVVLTFCLIWPYPTALFLLLRYSYERHGLNRIALLPPSLATILPLLLPALFLVKKPSGAENRGLSNGSQLSDSGIH